jgi:hypothetical protein
MNTDIMFQGQDDSFKPNHLYIEWFYPEIYDKQNQSTIEIDMTHTRSANSIRIKFDSERNGWVIDQATKLEWEPEDTIQDPCYKEVAFIKAWDK